MTDEVQNNANIVKNFASRTCQNLWINDEYEPGLVSIIVPTYNRAHTVGCAIRSVLSQTYQNFDIIVVDDGSVDNTEDTVKGLEDPRIRYIRHERNRGGSAARNTGIKAARGEYIAFQDSDDEWLPEKLSKQMQVFANGSIEAGVVYTRLWRIKDGKKVYTPSADLTQIQGNIHNKLLRGNFVATPTAVVRKECFERAGMFDEQLPRFQDWDLFIRISRFYEFACVNEPLVVSYLMPDSISANSHATIKALELLLEKYYEEFENDKRSLASIQYTVGNLCCQSGKINQGRAYLLKSAKLYPWSIKCLVATFASLFGNGAYVKVARLKHGI
jgi:glycosyltransferase involved in cell wall biosynthesis